ncbi:MAG: nickel pincer cofactor biosynthesis protein LarB [Myxococcota bacterium]
MDRDRLHALLLELERGEISRDEVLEQLARLPFRQLEDARVDTHRALRSGQPEVVLGEGKAPDQIARIVRVLAETGGNVLVTRVSPDVALAVCAEIPELAYKSEAGTLVMRQGVAPPAGRGTIAVVSAGTADRRVAEEACVTAELFGNKVERLYDVGVAGMHRLLASVDVLRSAHVLIAIAGMEGALPSVVAGLVDRPVIAVPTSVGYGASFGGVAALLGMLNSCASNVTVVNIDNGFGAASVASLINR